MSSKSAFGGPLTDQASNLEEKISDTATQVKDKMSDLGDKAAEKIDENRDAAAGGLAARGEKDRFSHSGRK